MTTGKRLVVGIGIALLTALGAASTAQAQYGYPPPPPPRGMYRNGLTFGGSLGVGTITATACGPYCGGSGMIEGHIGGMLNPRLALMGDLWGSIHSWDDGVFTGTTYHGIYTVAVQYWATDIIWLKGGVGFGQMQLQYDGDAAAFGDESGLATLAAAGVEVVQSFNFALDLQLRFGHGFYSQGGDVNSVGFLVGVNWY
jgi:hypothetical protein